MTTTTTKTMTAKAKLDQAIANRKPKPQQAARFPKPAPIPAPKVYVETVEFARALDKVEQTLQSVLQAMAAHDARLVRTTETLTSLLKQIIDQDIKVEVPEIKIPARPTSFSVFVDDGDEPIEMRIQADSLN
jgi:hypothetical protein